jgi:FAD/FMN-containing dehydrogenase
MYSLTAVGSFPCVGVHGVMLGGGMGRLMGRYGLISDALLHAKVVLWNGTVLEASEHVNSDLFWGLRGAGHNLGVVIESTYKTWPDEGGLHYNADMIFTDDSIDGVVDAYRATVEDGLDPSLFLILGYIYDAEAKKVRSLNLWRKLRRLTHPTASAIYERGLCPRRRGWTQSCGKVRYQSRRNTQPHHTNLFRRIEHGFL